MKPPGLNEQLAAFFRAHPYQWLSMYQLAQVAGTGGWRTRVSNLTLGQWSEGVRMNIELRKPYYTIDANGRRITHSDRRYIPPQPAQDLFEVMESEERA